MADDNNLNINIGINPAGAESGARRTVTAVGNVVNETKELDAGFRRLKAAIDPAFAAQDKYNKTLAEYDRLLAAGKIEQAEYAAQVEVITRAYNGQIAALEKNSAAAKRASVEKAQAILQEVTAREAAAKRDKQIADQWVAQERANTAALKRELAERDVARRKSNLEAVEAARAAAAAAVASTRAGGGTVTKAAETAAVRAAAAAAKQANRERVADEQAADNEIKNLYTSTYENAKALSMEAAAVAANAAKQRVAAEHQVAEAVNQANSAEQREAMRAARAATVAAAEAAKDRTRAERELKAATDEQRRSTEASAKAAAQEARALNDIRASIDPAYAAQQRYNEVMAKATQLLMNNKLKTGEWTTIQKQAQIQMDINARSMGRMNQVGVQLGYQMQDVTASIASGINPLVIFAQQSGQVAYAMQNMGGVAGRVAGIMGGIWFQAILGAVIILASLWDANKKAEKSTKDVMDAEDRRRMSLKELTTALQDYTKAQIEANNATIENNRLQQQGSLDAQNEIINEMVEAQSRLARAQRALDDFKGTGDAISDIGALASLNFQLMLAQRNVEKLQTAFDKAAAANSEAQIKQSQTMAGLTEQEKREQMELQALTGAARRDLAAAAGDEAAQARIRVRYEQEYAATLERYKKLKAEESKATQQQIKDEALLYKSRNDAITYAGRLLKQQGFGVSEGKNFGGVKGNHPGMGNAAHNDHAIDINAAPGAGESTNPAIRARMDKMVREYQAAGFRILWNGKVYEPGPGGAVYDIKPGANQHKDHAHMEAPANLVGQSKGLGLAKGIVAAEDKYTRELETTEQRAAQALAELIDTKEQILGEDDSKTNEEKLTAVRKMEAERVEIITKAYGEQSKQAEQAKQHELQTIKRYNDAIIREEVDRLRKVQALGETKENTSFATAQNTTGTKSDDVDFRQSEGLITEKQALIEHKAILAEEYQDQVNHELAMQQLKVQRLEGERDLQGQSRERMAQINAEIEQAQAQHLSTMQGMQEQYARSVARIQRQQAAITIRVWAGVAQAFTSSLGSALQQMWMRQQSLTGALIAMGDQLVFKFMDMGVQMLQNWIMSLIAKKAVTTAANSAEVGIHTATEVAKTGITAGAIATRSGMEVAAQTATAISGAATRVSEVIGYAGVGAAAAYASTAAIPVVGPILAPGAAATALGAIMGFAPIAAAAGGWGDIPNDQMAMVHRKEMVLPAWIAEPMRAALKGGSAPMLAGAAKAGNVARESFSQSMANNFYYQPKTVNQTAQLSDLLQREGRTMRKWFKTQVRNGSLSMSSLP